MQACLASSFKLDDAGILAPLSINGFRGLANFSQALGTRYNAQILLPSGSRR